MTSRIEALEHRIAALESEIDRLSRMQKTGPNSDDLELVIGFVQCLSWMLETHVRVQAEYDQNVINDFAAVLLYESERLHPHVPHRDSIAMTLRLMAHSLTDSRAESGAFLRGMPAPGQSHH